MNSVNYSLGWYPKSAEDQAVLLTSHPVQLKKYVLPTPPLEAASDLALDRVGQGAACCGFVGQPRFGKSWAASYIQEEIQRIYPKILVLPLVCRLHNSKNPAVLCDWFSLTTGGPTGRSRREDPMIALVRRWGAEAMAKAAQHIVLLIDEIWRLTEDQLTTLADVTNLLQREGIRTTTISFGSMETISLKTMLLQSNRTDLIGRFLARLHTFDGIGSAEMLKKVLDAFDDPEIADYPAGSGCSFTQFFLPTAFNEGWRLSSCSDALWAEFKNIGPKKKFEVGAEYVFASIEWFLKKSMSASARKPDIDKKRLSAAVGDSGFEDSLYMIQNT